MKKILLILFCVATPSVVTGQDFSVSVAPYSFKFWGQVTGTASVSVDYTIPVKGKPVLGVHYFHKEAVGFSYMPIRFRFFEVGAIGTTRGFPTRDSVSTNIIARINIPIGRAYISYSHVSNGFGLQSSVNHGIDFVSISYTFR